jgi:hypothetical protein
MTASPSTLELPRDSTQFTLYNESEKRLTSGFGSTPTKLFVHTGDNWELVVPKAMALTGNGVEVQPGETRDWKFTVNTANLGSVTPDSENDAEHSHFRLPPGTYAFGCRLTPEQSDVSTLYTTVFSVSGESLRLLPSNSVDTHFRRGSTLTVKTQTVKEHDSSRRVSLLMERDSSSQQPATLSLFELYNPHYEQISSYDRTFVSTQIADLLRDAFALVNFSDKHVTVQTVDTARPPLGMGENDSLVVRYNGSTWTLTAQNGWE